MYYAQFGTDEFLSTLFDDNYKGVCIEVGSAQPIYGNNTYFFEQKGWTTYCIEPNPKLVERLIPIRKNVYNFAVGSVNSDQVDFNICTLHDGNQEAISGLQIDGRLIQSHQSYSPKLTKIQVQVKTLDTFINENNIEHIDFISIDTEGTELDVLKGLDLKKYRPRVFVIENNFDEQLIRTYLNSFGYKFIKRLGVNDFFEKEFDHVSNPVIKYSTTGNIGDVIHELYVMKKFFEKTNLRGRLLLKDRQKETDGFFYRELYLISQEINDLMTDSEYFEKCDIFTENNPYIIDLDKWRTSEFIYKFCWTEMLSKQYELELNYEGENVKEWVEKTDIDFQDFKDKVVIHQSNEWYRKIDNFPWESIIENNNCVFVSFNPSQYDNFKFKDNVHLHLMSDLSEFKNILSNCKFYVGNLTSLTALAHSMRIPRLIEFTSINTGDFRHYFEEKKYSENFFYISEQEEFTSTEGIENFIIL